MQTENKEKNKIFCGKCQIPLIKSKVNLQYLKNTFSTELLKCPLCGMVFVPEELAEGKMAQVEKSLEDK